ncbi:MAG: CPBP family intramembrane metalloprotease [Deltaproteobacteria bacterium]|nr:CPBP family intramembrane metalloprotease [Deltaproteobacteria bacterium]
MEQNRTGYFEANAIIHPWLFPLSAGWLVLAVWLAGLTAWEQTMGAMPLGWHLAGLYGVGGLGVCGLMFHNGSLRDMFPQGRRAWLSSLSLGAALFLPVLGVSELLRAWPPASWADSLAALPSLEALRESASLSPGEWLHRAGGGAAEEWIFRAGFFYHGLRILRGKTHPLPKTTYFLLNGAVWMVSVNTAFGLLHLSKGGDMILVSGLGGTVLSLMFLHKPRFVPAALLHALFNLSTLSP